MSVKRLIELLGLALLVMVSATGVTACSKEGDVAGINYTNPEESINPSMNCSFIGVWSVDEIVADTVDVDIAIGSKGAYQNYVSFYGFPYQAIVNMIMSGKKVMQVRNYVPSIPMEMRSVGYSDKTLYFEFEGIPTQSFDPQVLHFDVTFEDGKEMGMFLHYVPGKSVATIDSKGENFSCVILIDQIVYYEKEGLNADITDIMEKKLDHEIKLKYISIQRIKGATVGN